MLLTESLQLEVTVILAAEVLFDVYQNSTTNIMGYILVFLNSLDPKRQRGYTNSPRYSYVSLQSINT